MTRAPRRRAAMELTDVRRHHLSLVLETLLRDGDQSRAQVAQRTGLTKATVSALVNDLLSRGLVEERELQRSGGVGRPGTDVAAAGWSVGALGLQVDVDFVAACVVDLAGTVRSRERRAVHNARVDPSLVIERVHEVAVAVLDDATNAGIRCVGGAVAVPGLVDRDAHEVVLAPNLDWRDVVLPAIDLSGGITLDLDNEANFAALGELRHGAARDLEAFVYVSGGVGVGGAVVLGGALVRGMHGFAGEVGHVTVDPRGPRCACGAKGCLEVYVGAGLTFTAPRAARALATALRPVVHVLDPQAVILGGALAETPGLAGHLQSLLDEETLAGRRHPVEVRPSVLGADAAVVGAASRALDAVLADPTVIPESDRSAEPQSA